MLRSLKDLEQYKVSATDGDVGTALNFLLDDERWAIRYLVLDTSGPLYERQVLVSPTSFRQIDSAPRRLHLALTRAKVRNGPGFDALKPVSRQHEHDYYRYYGYGPYWGYSGVWGMGADPGLLANEMWQETPALYPSRSGDIHLRSAAELRGYHVLGLDDRVGHVDDFIVDDATWEVRYFVVDTNDWWFGKKVLVAPRWTNRISWKERRVYVDVSRDTVKNGPEWHALDAISRDYETRLHEHHGRPNYWDEGDRTAGSVPPHHSA